MDENNSVLRFFSTLTGMILFFFVAASFVDQSILRIPIRLGSFSLVIPIQLFDLLNLLISVFCAAGVFRLLSERFDLSQYELFLKTFLPFACTLIMGVSLKNSSGGTAWWLILFFGGLMLLAVLSAVYASSNYDSVWQPFSMVFLTGLSGAVFFLGVIAVRTNVLRLVLEIPVLFFVGFAASQSIFSLWLHKLNFWMDSLAAAVTMVLFGMGMHYMPLNAISYGILFFLWYYLFVSMDIMLESDLSPERAFIRQLPVVVLLVGFLLITIF